MLRCSRCVKILDFFRRHCITDIRLSTLQWIITIMIKLRCTLLHPSLHKHCFPWRMWSLWNTCMSGWVSNCLDYKHQYLYGHTMGRFCCKTFVFKKIVPNLRIHHGWFYFMCECRICTCWHYLAAHYAHAKKIWVGTVEAPSCCETSRTTCCGAPNRMSNLDLCSQAGPIDSSTALNLDT